MGAATYGGGRGGGKESALFCRHTYCMELVYKMLPNSFLLGLKGISFSDLLSFRLFNADEDFIRWFCGLVFSSVFAVGFCSLLQAFNEILTLHTVFREFFRFI